MKKKLLVELVPSGAWGKNLRSELTTKEWDKLRKQCYKDAGYKCEICKEKGPKWPVECHEIWSYDDKIKKQTLDGLIALCPNCHSSKHYGLAQIKGKDGEAREKIMKVNNWTEKEVIKHIEEAFTVWYERSEYDWELDINWLNENK